MSTANRENIDKKINIYADSGVRYYLKRVFFGDSKIVKDLDAVGCGSRLEELNEKNKNNKAKFAPDEFTEYNKLVERLNTFCHGGVSAKSDRAWLALEKDINNYFRKNLNIYSLRSGLQSTEKVGYYLDTKTGELKYSDGEAFSHIGYLDITDDKVKELFHNILNPGIKDKMISGTKRMNLTPELFINMITYVQKKDEDAIFYVKNVHGQNNKTMFPANKDFVDIFVSLQDRYKAKVAVDRLATVDGRNLEQMITDLSNSIRNRATTYKNSSSDEAKKGLMDAVIAYLNDGDSIKFGKAVNKNNGWFSWLPKLSWPDEADKILKDVRKMQNSPFLDAALQDISKRSKTPPAPFNFEVMTRQKNAVTKEMITTNWEQYRITKESYLKILDSLDDVLNNEDSTLYPIVELPSNIAELNGDNRIINYLQNLISKDREEINSQSKDQPNYQNYCSVLQENILKILSVRELKPTERRRITTEQGSFYNLLGDKLCQALAEVDKHPVEEKTQMISIAAFRDEVTRLKNLYESLKAKLNNSMTGLDALNQTDISNDLDEYFDKKFVPFMERLASILEYLQKTQDKEFDLLHPEGDIQIEIRKQIEDLREFSTSVYDDTLAILTTQSKYDSINKKLVSNFDVNGQPSYRAYYDTHHHKNKGNMEEYKKLESKFVEIMREAVQSCRDALVDSKNNVMERGFDETRINVKNPSLLSKKSMFAIEKTIEPSPSVSLPPQPK